MTNEQFDQVVDDIIGSVSNILINLQKIRKDRYEGIDPIDKFLENVKKENELLYHLLCGSTMYTHEDTLAIVFPKRKDAQYQVCMLPGTRKKIESATEMKVEIRIEE